ncbi:hypothetical protein BMF94_3852 [Rhodotorula taiwanensis]|uniref:Xylanolytic transcriptional activator regulatory domain-containing protein n=1 Tax=Rhodotorula taiwanensis TaxID=741276 RepID=A0A2S5B8L1_9BASI|nr:hypothetical protein BMF94_3852 [Rhodotorula taiwanensis]
MGIALRRYIEAIESRLHRMEVLLGGLLGSDDPRAQTLLGELIGTCAATRPRSFDKKVPGDSEARDILAKDLKAAAAVPDPKDAKRSWKREYIEQGQAQAQAAQQASSNTPKVEPGAFPTLPGQPAFVAAPGPLAIQNQHQHQHPQYQDEMYRTPPGGAAESTASDSGASPLGGGGPAAGLLSPRQRRRTETAASTSPEDDRKQMAYAFRLPPIGATAAAGSSSSARSGSGGAASSAPPLPPDRVGHTGTSTYTLTQVGAADGEAATNEPLTELADVVGQLSLNENAEVRYHGRSSGLYLISKSQRYRDFFWHFPSSTFWPPLEGLQRKTEREILGLEEGEDPLPDLETQSHLLMAYWTYVHPHFPVCYKVAFLRQYRHALAHPDSTEPSTPAGTGKVPTVLLLSMFAVAARYCDIDKTQTEGGKLWPAGQEYLDKARLLLNYDYGSSKLVTVQALLLISYREVGVGAMSSAWMTAGMAIRMAQDLGLFRDVEKWFVPIQRFSHEEKQTRKRVWWACVILDRYTASYIGRPGTIHERDYDCGFPSEDEPDEHEQWRPVRIDGTEFSGPPKSGVETLSEENLQFLRSYPPTRAHTISTFNAKAALAVIINRIISNIYAIRIRVLGQSSETLLSLLDQSLASWFLALPPQLQYNPASKNMPPPHFYNSLILLHRPFIPGQNSVATHGNFPSHGICTTAANAIANIVTKWRKTWTLRQCPPFLTYPIFSAGIICVYNASFDESLAHPAKVHLKQCMEALEEMEHIWGSATRQRELLHGLVDLRDADLTTELGLDAAQVPLQQLPNRGLKRAGMDVDESGKSSGSASPAAGGVRTASTFHQKPMRAPRPSAASQRRRSSASSTNRPAPTLQPLAPKPNPSSSSSSSSSNPPPSLVRQGPQPDILEEPAFLHGFGNIGSSAMAPFPIGTEMSAQSFDILNRDIDLNLFRSRPGSSGGTNANGNPGSTNYADLLNTFFPGMDGSAWPIGSPSAGSPFAFSTMQQQPQTQTQTPAVASNGPGSGGAAMQFAQATGIGGEPATSPPLDQTPAFFGMPLGANLGDEWLNYSYNAFPGMSDMLATSPSSASAGGGPIDATTSPASQFPSCQLPLPLPLAGPAESPPHATSATSPGLAGVGPVSPP